MSRQRPINPTAGYWTVAEAAAHFNVSETTIRRMIEDGSLLARRLRGAIRIPTNQPDLTTEPRPPRRGRRTGRPALQSA
jgi:excisionase family DNA binding protein